MTPTHFKRVLITGTTSGLGQALHKHYASLGTQVIEVNRRAISQEEEIPVAHSEVMDITNPGEVYSFLHRLNRNGLLPDLFVLNAGTNLADNLSHFDYANYSKVMATNLNGVLTFVSAIQRLGLKGKTIVAMSSVSNILPNAGHIGYHISKWALQRSFEMLAMRDSHNQYKTVVLGPVKTKIQSHYPPAMGLEKTILNALLVDADSTAKQCATFFQTKRSLFLYPKRTVLFYYLVKLVLLFFPFLYGGTRPTSLSSPPQTAT